MMARPLELPELIDAADVILLGRVEDIRSRWQPSGKGIETDVRIAPLRILYGPDSLSDISLTLPGGRIGETQVLAGGMPSYAVGEEIVGFFRRMPDASLRSIGGFQGKYSVGPGNIIRELGVSVDRFQRHLNGEPVEEFGRASLTTASLTIPTINAIRWPGSAPIPYYVNEDGSSPWSISPEAMLGVTTAAFATWEAVPSSSIAFKYEGGSSRDGREHFDGYNDIAWGNDSDFDTVSTLALTFLSWHDGYFVEADILLNGSREWAIDGVYHADLQTVLLHEIGHFLGLAHSRDESAAMYAAYSGLRRELGEDDVAKVTSLYPVDSQPRPSPTEPTGLVFNVDLLAGWNLVQFEGIRCLPLSEATTSIYEAGALGSVWGFLASQQKWRGYDPNVPEMLNNLSQVCSNNIIWLHMTAPVSWAVGP
jgi:hypothetical protein